MFVFGLEVTDVRGHQVTSGVRVDPGGSRVNLERTAIKNL